MMNSIYRLNWPLLGRLFWSFFKMGPVTFGGGYAMIPVFHQEVVEKRGWLEEEEVTDLFAIAQSTPGAVGVNASVFVGYRIAGLSGALAALLGVLLPTFLIVLVLSMAFLAVRDQPKIKAAFLGIRPAVVALIVYAGIRVGRTAIKDLATLVTAAGVLVLLIATGINPVFALLMGMAVGMVIVPLRLRWTGTDVLAGRPGKTGRYVEDYFFGDGI
ncbi:MAG: chromate transporter [Paenibacillaceae bacterium]|nr:chromate transporter [Paenibacillaceae bacterium]